MLELNKIAKVRPRVQALITQEKFPSRSSDISMKIELMSTAFQKVFTAWPVSVLVCCDVVHGEWFRVGS
jgi:hypothetical protein